MEEGRPDLIVKYKADDSRIGLIRLGVLAPIWAGWMPWVMSWLIRPILQEGFVGYEDLAALFAFFMLVSLTALAGVLICLDTNIVLGEKGIRLPTRFLLETLGLLRADWQQLMEVHFTRQRVISEDPDAISLLIKQGGVARMSLEGLSREDVPKILLAVQAYAPLVPISPAAMGDKQATSGGKNPLSFTRIWEDQLNSRFGSTIFVPLEPGNQLQNGRLKIVGQIAFGGLSAIYLAKQDNSKLVAIKEAVVPQNADEESKAKALEMFSREASFLVKLEHPRIARVFDHFVEGGRNYMVLEYIEGKDLRSYVKENGPVTSETALRWCKEIAEILQYLHEQPAPIVHRDLTPDNLVLAKDGSIHLIDFGAANTFMGTATGTLVGKQSYISPEQFRGKAVPQSDLYSLGATLFYLVTGKDPEPLAVSHPKEVASDISTELDDIVAALTEQDVDDRVSNANALIERIAESSRGKILKSVALKIKAL